MQVKCDGDVTAVLKDSDFPRGDTCEDPGKRDPRHPFHRSCEDSKSVKLKEACRSSIRTTTAMRTPENFVR